MHTRVPTRRTLEPVNHTNLSHLLAEALVGPFQPARQVGFLITAPTTMITTNGKSTFRGGPWDGVEHEVPSSIRKLRMRTPHGLDVYYRPRKYKWVFPTGGALTVYEWLYEFESAPDGAIKHYEAALGAALDILLRLSVLLAPAKRRTSALSTILLRRFQTIILEVTHA